MGFFTFQNGGFRQRLSYLSSQSLSGWDGVFHREGKMFSEFWSVLSQSLSGWDGVFHELAEMLGAKPATV